MKEGASQISPHEHILYIALEIEVPNLENSSWKSRATLAHFHLHPGYCEQHEGMKHENTKKVSEANV